MLCLVLEIVLTIVVCVQWGKAKMGWAWGLVPIGVGFGFGLLLGTAIGSSATSYQSAMQSIQGPSMIVDILVVVALIIMSRFAQKKIKEIEAAKKAAAVQPQEKSPES